MTPKGPVEPVPPRMTVPDVVLSAVGFSVRVEVVPLVLMMLRVFAPIRPLSD